MTEHGEVQQEEKPDKYMPDEVAHMMPHTGNCCIMVFLPELFHFNLLSKGSSRTSGRRDESGAVDNLIAQS